MKKGTLGKIVMSLMLVMCLGVAFVGCGPKAVNENITVVTREDGSGTKGAFMEIIGLKGKKDVDNAIQATSTAAVLQAVKGDKNAIAFDSLGYVTDEVKKLNINGVAPTIENIKSGSYPIARPLNVVYKESTLENDATRIFKQFLESKDAQEIISANGYVSTKDSAEKYVVTPGVSGKINISGSTSLQPLMLKLVAEFEKVQPNIEITVGAGGSGQGYKDAEAGVSEFGMISEPFKEAKAPNCKFAEVARDGIAIIVNKENPVDSLTLEQLKNIYNRDAGEAAITKWSQIK